METTYTYVVANSLTNRIKIGRTTNLKQRLRSLSTQGGVELEIVAVLGTDQERSLHQQFSQLRTIGEWFIDDGEIRDFLSKNELEDVLFCASRNIKDIDLNRSKQDTLKNADTCVKTIPKTDIVVTEGEMRKRLFRQMPTLRQCKYKPEKLKRSIEKFHRYKTKLSLCVLVVADFYFQNLDNLSIYKKLPLTNLHGIFSNGFKKDFLNFSMPQDEDHPKVRRAKAHNYKEEVDAITDVFLILQRRANIRFGPTLWQFRQLDLEDATLIEIKRLVEVYRDQLDYLNSKFEESIEAESIVLDNIHLEQNDIDLIIDIVQLWVGDARGEVMST